MITLQLADLQGNIVATAADIETATELLSTYNSTEFGTPTEGKTPPKYAWLRAAGVSSETAYGTGLVAQGGASYVPQVARDLQTAAPEPPGAFPDGQGTGEQYCSEIPGWYISLSGEESANTLAEWTAEQEALARELADPEGEGLLTGDEASELASILTAAAVELEGVMSESVCNAAQASGELCPEKATAGITNDRVIASKLEWCATHIKATQSGYTRTCFVSFSFSRLFGYITAHYGFAVRLCFSSLLGIGHPAAWYCEYKKRWVSFISRGWWRSVIRQE